MISNEILVWLLLAAVSLTLHSLGLYMIFRLKRRKISDFLIAHLSLTEVALVIYELIFCVLNIESPEIIGIGTYETGLVILIVAQFLAMLMITFDRVLKVKLTIKYDLVVTKKKLLLACIPCWLICAAHGLITWYFPHLFNKMFLGWEIFVVIVLFFSYTYIYIYFRMIRKKTFGNNASEARGARAIKLNLKVPTMIIVSFLLFYVTPEILLATKICVYTPVFNCVFILNNISDAVVYILGTPKIRKRICCCMRSSNHARNNTSCSTVSYADVSV